MARLAFDSCFLIDLERERAGRAKQGGAIEFLELHQKDELLISPVALAEFAIGFANFTHPVLAAVVHSFALFSSSVHVASCYALIYRQLATTKNIIGTNDLWIAAFCVAYDVPLVTRNIDEFRRVGELKVIGY